MRSLDSRAKASLTWLGVMLVPVFVVQSIRMLSGGDTSSAKASITPDTAPVIAPAKPMTPAQREAVLWVRENGFKPISRSPMDRVLPPSAPAIAQAEPEVAPEPAVPDDTPRDLRVTGMIGDDSGALVAINHKLRRIGDEVAPGWTISAINSRNRLVTLAHADGRTLGLEPKPSSK